MPGMLPRGAGTSHKHRPMSPWWVCGVIVRMIKGPCKTHKDPLLKRKGMREATWLAALCGKDSNGLAMRRMDSLFSHAPSFLRGYGQGLSP